MYKKMNSILKRATGKLLSNRAEVKISLIIHNVRGARVATIDDIFKRRRRSYAYRKERERE